MNSNATRPVWFSDTHGATSFIANYTIGHKADSSGDSWNIVPVTDDPGFFTLQQKGKYLGTASGDAGRAWGAAVALGESVSPPSGTERSRQQWYFEKIRSLHGKTVPSNRYRLINRYSGLALSFPGNSLSASDLATAVTVPIRDWDTPKTGDRFKVWRAAEQELSLTAR